MKSAESLVAAFCLAVMAIVANPSLAAAGQAQILLQPGVSPRVGMLAYATDNCLYQFDGFVWQSEGTCRHFPDPRNDKAFDLYDRASGSRLASISLEDPEWYLERKASGPAAGIWFKVPMRDLLTHGQVGPNNTYALLEGRWIKQLDLQESYERRRQAEIMARMTPEQAQAYAALLARMAEANDNMAKIALGYRWVWK